jgi:NADH-quinone oxidoreductase subunit J
MMELYLFYMFAAVAIGSSLLVVLFRNPVNCALSLVATLFCVAALFVLLEAYFLAAVQIIVYAGAIMVLFLFVIMLLNLGHPEVLEPSTGKYRKLSVVLLVAILALQITSMATRWMGGPAAEPDAGMLEDNIHYIGTLLYTDFLFPFEIVSLILLVALVGVMVLVKREPRRATAPNP